jgi:hypothetical protein
MPHWTKCGKQRIWKNMAREREEAWYIRFVWYRCSCASGVRLERASGESEARETAARLIGVAPETLTVTPCPEMGEQYRFLCRSTARGLETGGPLSRRRR